MAVSGIKEIPKDDLFPKSDSVIDLFNEKSYTSYSQFNEFISPITLTEGWLVKLGLKIHPKSKTIWYPASPHKSAYFKIVNGHEFIVCFNRNNNCVEIPLILVMEKSVLEIHYVHEFQNFYFSCNKEDITC